MTIYVEQCADRFELIGESTVPIAAGLGVAALTYETRHCAPPTYRVRDYVFLTVVSGGERYSTEGAV